MTRREKLQEQYEDALFALLMDDFAVSEGKSAEEENERLKNDPSCAVPPEVRRRCLKMISRYFTKKSLYRTGNLLRRGFIKVAVVGMICTILVSTAFAISPSFRVRVLNFAIEVFDNKTEFSFLPSDEEDNTKNCIYVIEPKWLPMEYSLVDQTDSKFRSAKVYSSEEGVEISISVFSGENNVLGIDTESADTESVIIQNREGMISLKEGISHLVWGNEEEGYKVYIVMNSIEDSKIQELLFIAENLSIERK